MTIGWTVLVAWHEVSSGNHDGLAATAIVVGVKVAPAAPIIVIYAIMAISAVDLSGGLVVVTARYLTNKFVKPLIERHKAEGREEERRLWVQWNRRRLEAEANGRPFHEPPPSSPES